MTEPVWGPVHRDIVDLLADHPADVPAVVDHLTKLQDLLVRLLRCWTAARWPTSTSST